MNVDDKFKKAQQQQTSTFTPGNIFNVERDSKGKGISLDDLIAAL